MRPRESLLRALLAGALFVASLPDPLAAGAGSATSPAARSPASSESAAALATWASASSASWASLSTWRGGIDLYRPGVFSTQRTWYWCTAATVQISRNVVLHQTDHSATTQRAYFDWMRPRDRYRLPLSAGVDAAGWTAGFAHFVDPRYRLHASATFDAALRSAVTNLRKANLPVALAVQHGNHAWLLTGFTATADPARTSAFTVTSVRVTGPLYGLQSKNGYDMPPDTRLTPTQLRHYFTPWYYAPIRMVWDGRYVSIQPSGTVATTSSSPMSTPAATASLPPATGAAFTQVSPSSTAVGPTGSTAGPSADVAAVASPVAVDVALSATSALQPVGVAPLVIAGALVILVAMLVRRWRSHST